MDLRTQRYMQRIEQIMQLPKKGTPHRPSKSPISCKANHLDTYLKYELSSKIIQKILDQNHQKLVQLFFNIIRITEYRQKEKIYRFIAVQKAEPTKEVWIDASIVCKILTTTLKGLLRKKYVDFIQALHAKPQAYDVTPRKGKMERRLTVNKDSSPLSARKRTLTYVSQMEKGSSRNLSEIDNFENSRSQNKIKDFAVKNIAKIIAAKINKFHYFGLYKIRVSHADNNMEGQMLNMLAITLVRQQKKDDQKQVTELKAFRKSASIMMFFKIISKVLSQDFSELKKYKDLCQKRVKTSRLISTKISKIFDSNKYRLNHHFFIRIKSIVNAKKAEQQEKQFLQLEIRSKSAIKSSQKSHLSEVSHVQPFNPIARLNFYEFIDKIVKLMMVVSKLLIPMKQAFVKIDQYASYSYRIQQSLKCVPRRVLSDAFLSIKRFQRGEIQQLDFAPEKIRSINNIYDILHPLLKMRFIEGFTHIKVISKERDLKIKILPAKQNIILLTKKFIIDRDQYTTQSYEHLQELKSTLFFASLNEGKKIRSSIR